MSRPPSAEGTGRPDVGDGRRDGEGAKASDTARDAPCAGDVDGDAERVSELVVIGTATMFLTRLPVGRHASGDPRVLARAARWFPLVGLLVGGLLAALWLLAQSLLPSSLSVLVVLVAGVLVTGAFHEDGLADVADGAGAFDREAKLEIMRDSRVGTYGALALVLLVLARFLLLWELTVMPPETVVAALLAAHVLARWSSLWLMARVSYARPESGNRVVVDGVDARRLLEGSLVALVALVPAVLLGGTGMLLLAPLALAVAAVAGTRFRRRLGGITGDCLGAANVLVELAVLLGALVLALR